MKYFKLVTILLFSAVISFYSCNDTSTKNNTTNTQTKEDPKPIDFSNPTNTQTSNQTPTEAAQNAQGVYHYTCSQGCAGGAGSAVNCSTCGNLLAHNQAYHANANNTSNDSPFTPPPPPPTEASQNSAGVWHYTCGNGCAGGAGSASACGTCGNTLVHNTAYHQ